MLVAPKTPGRRLDSVWVGFRWKTVAAPPGGFAKGIIPGELSCVSKRLCIAVGNDFHNGQGGAMRWDGSKWHAMTLANPASGTLLGSVSCAAANSCMAVGSRPATNRTVPVAEHWNGLRWTLQSLPRTSAWGLDAISCPDTTHCIAVSGDRRQSESVIESWDGTSWSLLPPAPTPVDSTASYLTTISCVSPTSCMATGSVEPSGGLLAERWNGSAWIVVPAP